MANTVNVVFRDELTGEEIRKVVGFTTPTVRLADSSVVDADLLVRVANGKTLTKKQAEGNPILNKLSQEDALLRITYLTQVQYGYLDVVDAEEEAEEDITEDKA